MSHRFAPANPRTHPDRTALVLLGPPGVGKGTQGRLLADEDGILVLSTGDILRSAVRTATPLGLSAQGYMRAGELVPDELIDGLMAARIADDDARAGFILDGYPRTVAQARSLTDVLERLRQPLSAAILFEVADDVVVQRLSGRRSCPTCGRVYHVELNPPRGPGRCDADQQQLVRRDDDSPETIMNRLAVYRRDTEPVAGYYRARGALVTVNAARSADEVHAALRTALGACHRLAAQR
jgi:adenylate kinase